MKDIARATGLSTATVDRVLNDRPGVRPETRSLVTEALQALGYSVGALRSRGIGSDQALEVLLSQGTNPFFERMRAGFVAALAPLQAADLKAKLGGFDPYDAKTVVDRLNQVAPETTCVITVGVDTPEVAQAIDTLVARGVRVVTVVSDVPGSRRAAYVGQDGFAAGRTAGRLMGALLRADQGSVAMLLGHLRFRHLLDRQAGFQQVLGGTKPDMDVISTKPYGTDPAVGREIVEKLFARYPDLKGIYLPGGGQPHLVEAVAARKTPGTIVIGHEATAVSATYLRQGVFDAILSHDVHEVGRRALDAAFGQLPQDETPCSVNIYVQDNFPSLD